MHIDLKAKKTIATGSTAGIGRAVAGGGGWHAPVLRSSSTVAARSGSLPHRGSFATLLPTAGITGFSADLATAEGADDFAVQTGDVDILINNVGTAKPKSLESADGDWRGLFGLNVMSRVRMTRHHLPAMTKRGWRA